MSDLDLDAIRTHIERAHDEVSELCLGTRRWTMRIPAQPDRDSDLVIADALADAERLLAEVERLRANQLPDGGQWDVEYAHRAGPDERFEPWRRDVAWQAERVHKYCIQGGCRQRRVWYGPVEPVEPAARR